MINNNGHVYAITGASGHLGRLALTYLLELVPAEQILATTRRPDLLSDFTAQGVTVRRADFSDPPSLTAAFSGATRILIISTNEYPMEIRSAQHREAIKAAVNAGVGHITSTYFSLSKAAKADDDNPWTRGREKTMDALARRWSDLHKGNLEIRILPGGEVIERLVSNGLPLQSAQQIVGYCDMFRLFDVNVSDTVKFATGKPPVSADELLRNLIIPE